MKDKSLISFISKVLNKYDLELKKVNIKENTFFRPITTPETTNISLKIVATGVYVKSFTDKYKSKFYPFSPTEHKKLTKLEQATYTFTALSTDLETEYTKLKKINFKKIKGLFGIKKDNDNKTLVLQYKAFDGTRIVNYQFISETGKYFLSQPEKEKQSLKGAYAYIRKPSNSFSTVYICEGLATGLSVCQAMPEAGVVIAFNDTNAISVARQLKADWTNTNLILCGELDKKGNKHSVYKRQENNFLTIYPSFIKEKGTDFNDLACIESVKKVREQLLSCSFNGNFPMPLGRDTTDGIVSYYAFSERTQSIVKIKEDIKKIRASLFSDKFLLQNFPMEKYVNKETSITIINWEKVYRYLTDACLAVGEQKYKTSISYGVRKIEGQYIFNNGTRLYEIKDKKVTPLAYTPKLSAIFKAHATMNFKNVDTIKPWSAKKISKLTQLLTHTDYKEKGSHIIYLGVLAQSILRGINSWGGNLHIGGASTTGKSDIKSQQTEPLMPSEIASLVLDGTEDSRQTVLRNLDGACLLVRTDELERDGAEKSTIRKMEGIIDLVREGTEGLNNTTTKTDNLQVKHFLKCFTFMSMSILHNVRKRQDFNRFIFLELVRNKESTYKEAKPKLAKLIQENPLGFAKKALIGAEEFQEIFKCIFKFLEKEYPNQNDHKHRNLATALAGYTSIAELPKAFFCTPKRMATFSWVYKQYEHTKEDDKVDKVEMFLGLQVLPNMLGNNQNTNMAFACQAYNKYNSATAMLKANKIKFDVENKILYIAPKAEIFKKLLRLNNSGLSDLREDFRDHENVKEARYRIDKVQVRGLAIDLNAYPLFIDNEEDLI